MRHLHIYLLIGLLVLLLGSCFDNSSDMALLQRCESISYNQPSLALKTLDSINFPETFDTEQRNRYLLRQIQVRHQVGVLLTSELSVPQVTAYFERKGDWEHAALSEYVQGLLWMEKEQFIRATPFYKNALKYAELDGNPSLIGMLLLEAGRLQLKRSDWAMADESLQRAQLYFRRIGNATQEVEVLLMLGAVREQIGDFETARTFRHKALARTFEPIDRAKCHLALCELDYMLDQKDSLNVEADKLCLVLTKVEDPAIRRSGWQFLAQWYQESDNSQKARNAKVQLDLVFKEMLSGEAVRSLLNETSKLNRIRSLYNDRLSARKAWMNGLILMIVFIILYVLYRNKRHRSALRDAESKIETLQTLAMEFDRKENNLRQLALKHFDILKKVALLDGMMNDLKTGQEKRIHALFNQAVYENNSGFDWDTFFKSLNQLKDGIPEKVRSFYPQLTETEYRILILSFTGLSNKETSIILNLSTNTINSLRTSIRRKLQVPEYGDLEEFVTNQLNGLNKGRK